MQQSYWDRLLTRRLSRRRAMIGTGVTAAGAAFLIACGSDDDTPSGATGSTGTTSATGGSTGSTGATGGGGSTGATGATGSTGTTGGASSGLLNQMTDTTAQAKHGGTLVDRVNREPGHFDGQAQGQVQLNFFNSLSYESLVRNVAGHMERSSFSEVEGHLAESWEFNPDGTQLTFKLRQGVKWHNTDPVNGRAFDAEDVVASWNRYVAQPANNRAAQSNMLNPSAPIISVEAPDSSTVVVTLSEPTSYLLQRYTSMVTGELGSIYPREADGGFDPRESQIGTGPYILDKFEPSVELGYRKNPDYWDSSAGYPDMLHIAVIPEYASALAQFQTGNIYGFQITAEDMVATKKSIPDINLFPLSPRATNPAFQMRFGWQPIGDKPSPFLDIRVRQALALALEREDYINAFWNVAAFGAEGIPVEIYFDTAQGHNAWTLDPRDTGTFGENAMYYPAKANLEEAMKLIEAARSSYGGDFPAIPSAHVDIFGGNYPAGTDAMDNFARSLGFEIEAQKIVYNTDYLPKYVTQRGQFQGILYGIGATPSADVTDFYVWKYYGKSGETSGSLGHGGPDGSTGDGSGDPEVDALIEDARHELDSETRRELIGNLQRVLAKQQYAVSPPGVGDEFVMAWPVMSNYNVWQDDSRTVSFTLGGLSTYWIDPTKPPLA